MPLFTIFTTARADITETWQIEAADEAQAREWFEECPDGQVAVLIEDSVDGNEEEREITSIEPAAAALVSRCDRIPADDLHALATELLSQIEDDLFTHVYGEDDTVPADSGHVELINRARKLLGMEPAGIETVPVWSYSATFCDKNGERASYSTEVYNDTAEGALILGRMDLDITHRGASKVDASVICTARGEA